MLGIETVSGETRYFVDATIANLREHPLAVGRVWLKKVRLFFQADEIKRNYPIYPVRHYSNVMRVLLWKWSGPGGVIGLGFPFGLVLPLAVAGWWTLRKRGIRLRAVELIVVGHFAANLLFFICSRYRVPLTPFLVLYAAAAVQWAAGERIWRSQSLRRHWRPLTVALGVFLFSNAGLVPMDNVSDRGEYEFFLGLAAHKHRNEPREAVEHYLAALRDLPDFAEAHHALGVVYGRYLDEQAKALEQFEWVLEHDPGNIPVMYNKAIALARMGRRSEARAVMEILVENAPENKEFRRFLEMLSGKETEQPSGIRTQEMDRRTSIGVEGNP